MGYRIVYPGQVPKRSVKPGNTLRLRTLIAGALLLFSISVRLLWPEGAQNLRSLIIPTHLSNTELAFSKLIYEIQNGISLDECLVTFCHRIINEAS